MRLDIVIPAHNEEHRIDRTLRAYRAGFPQPDVRFLVALDGCRDRTADVVARATPRTTTAASCCTSTPKLGKGGVIMETFRRCDADLVGFVDADCATPPAELLRLTPGGRRADGVIASRAGIPASVTARAPRPLRAQRHERRFAWGVRRLSACPTPTRSAARRCCTATSSSGSCRCCRRATSCSTSTCSSSLDGSASTSSRCRRSGSTRPARSCAPVARLAPDGRLAAAPVGRAGAPSRAASPPTAEARRPEVARAARLTSPSSPRTRRAGERHGGPAASPRTPRNLAHALAAPAPT